MTGFGGLNVLASASKAKGTAVPLTAPYARRTSPSSMNSPDELPITCLQAACQTRASLESALRLWRPGKLFLHAFPFFSGARPRFPTGDRRPRIHHDDEREKKGCPHGQPRKSVLWREGRHRRGEKSVRRGPCSKQHAIFLCCVISTRRWKRDDFFQRRGQLFTATACKPETNGCRRILYGASEYAPPRAAQPGHPSP